MIEVWSPKYSTNSCLIATYKVTSGINKIKFTKAKHLLGAVFEADGDTIKACPIQKNGKGFVYVVPMNKLRRVS